MQVKEIRAVMDFIETLDLGVGFTEREWIDILDEYDSEDEEVTADNVEY